MHYYTLLQSKTHAFLLERRMRSEGILCELTFLPRALMTDLCSMGVKFHEKDFSKATELIWSSGLPGCRIFKETLNETSCKYDEVIFY